MVQLAYSSGRFLEELILQQLAIIPQNFSCRIKKTERKRIWHMCTYISYFYFSGGRRFISTLSSIRGRRKCGSCATLWQMNLIPFLFISPFSGRSSWKTWIFENGSRREKVGQMHKSCRLNVGWRLSCTSNQTRPQLYRQYCTGTFCDMHECGIR